ncbi:inner nuclear membrane protein enriched at telomere/subtelomere region [Agyrium rufum]|nr:inner nuclear membrane protein enriched at telomere/subtelomere region [Agyrium rufum]
MEDEMEYLSPGFNPATLTVPRLRSILVSHDIQYPSSAKKADLVDLFNSQLVPKAKKIMASRARTKRTSRGITDMPSSQEGTTNGDEAEEDTIAVTAPNTVRRRSARPSTRASTEDLAERQSASAVKTPSARRPIQKHPRTSDIEENTNGEAAQPASRKSRKSEITPQVKVEEPDAFTGRPALPESVFSHDNPFQSGSSPIAAETRRKSAGPTAARRKSTSQRRRTDGITPSDSSAVKQEDGVVVPTSRTFEVPLSRAPRRAIKREEPPEIEAGEEFTPEEQLELVQSGAVRGEVNVLSARRHRTSSKGTGLAKSAPWVVLLTIFAGYATWWRREKSAMGYCGLGNPSTSLMDYQVPEWASVLAPECEPCPQHAYCYSDMEARCEPDFVLHQHPLALGGLLPFPPTCEADGEKARKVKAVADRAVEELRERRAKWECGELTQDNGKAASKVEIEAEELKTVVSGKRRKGMTESEFEDLWRGALGEIIGRDEVTNQADGSSSLARLPIGCAIRRSARLTLVRYRVQLTGLILILSAVYAAQNQIQARRSDTARVPQLVSTTLDRLATQAALHSQGSASEPWISVGQMRDDVLRDEFSASRREAIWKRVKAIVEMNANIRPSVKEGRLGEVSRVWEWIGSVGFIEDGDRRQSGRYSLGVPPASGTPDGRTSPLGIEGNKEVVETRRWDEGRPIY